MAERNPMRLHRRIARVPDSAGETAHLSVYVVEHESWRCLVCSTENGDEWGRCMYCNQERGDWVCGCGRKNRKGDDECSECGRPNPDSE